MLTRARRREVLSGSAAGGGVPLSAASVAVASAGVVATVRVSYLPPGATARSLAWLLPVNLNGTAAHGCARLELWTPAAASGAVLLVDVRWRWP